jgi:branched-chain amino acid aminotransferase
MEIAKNAVVNVNGQLMSSDQAKVSVFDRSYLYGDSLYEVARTYKGQFFKLDEHLERMAKSAELCHMTLSQTLAQYKDEFYRTLEAFRRLPGMKEEEAYGRIVVSRGVGRIGFGLGCLVSPTQYTVIVQPVDAPTETALNQGLSLQVSHRVRNDRRALDPAMKSGNYLNSLLAYLESASEGFDDALLNNVDGHLTEGTTFNIFYVKRGIVVTPPLDVGILDGITRRLVLGTCRELGIPVRETRFPSSRLLEADEVFVSSSVKEVFPVTRVDGAKVGDGKPGRITMKLRAAYQKLLPSRAQAASGRSVA